MRTIRAIPDSRSTTTRVHPGTGQATTDLLARGASVHAIELGPAMADKLRANLTSDQLGLLDDIEAFIRSDFDGVVTRPLIATLTTAIRNRSRPFAGWHGADRGGR